MQGVLNGIRVLDFGRFIAGPYCAALLGDMGAEVIRAERIEGSEDRFTAPVAETGEGGTFLQLNRNKRSIALDPMSAGGRDIVRRLVATADVVVANLPATTLTSMGLDYDALVAVKPDIILATVSAFGNEGPYKDRVGFDGIGQVMSGAAYLSGEPERPVRWSAPYVDFSTALGCAFGVMCALYARRETGKGQLVEGSLLRSAFTLANSMLIEQAVLGLDRIPVGNRSYQFGPGDLFQTSDGCWILVQVIGPVLFARWATLMGEKDQWLSDPRFATDEDRGKNGDVLSERMARWCADRTLAEALDALAAARIPGAPMYTPQQALDDPHVRASGMFTPMDFPGLETSAPVVSPIVSMSETPPRYETPAPVLGADTHAILAELGYEPSAIEGLVSEGAVAGRRAAAE